jgi:hypothetical protein
MLRYEPGCPASSLIRNETYHQASHCYLVVWVDTFQKYYLARQAESQSQEGQLPDQKYEESQTKDPGLQESGY